MVRVAEGALQAALVREDDLEGYVLPKGGVEPGEDIAAAALREIDEEAGISEAVPLGQLAVLERQDSRKRWWSIIHYGLFLTEQAESVIKDTEHHWGFGWFPIDRLPPMFWPDEARMIAENRARIYDCVIAHVNAAKR